VFFLLRGESTIGEVTVEINQEDRIGLLADLWSNKFAIYKNGSVV
jgi:hypothetical protein